MPYRQRDSKMMEKTAGNGLKRKIETVSYENDLFSNLIA